MIEKLNERITIEKSTVVTDKVDRKSSGRQSMPLTGMPKMGYSPQGNWKPCEAPAV